MCNICVSFNGVYIFHRGFFSSLLCESIHYFMNIKFTQICVFLIKKFIYL